MNIPSANNENLRRVIDEHGVAGVVAVLYDDECDELFDELLTFVENATSAWDTPFSRSDKATWKQYFELAPLHGYLMQCFGIGNSPAVWLARQNPNVVNLFATFYLPRIPIEVTTKEKTGTTATRASQFEASSAFRVGSLLRRFDLETPP